MNNLVTQTSIRTADSVRPDWVPPREVAIGKSNLRSLMLAARLLLAETYTMLVQYSLIRVPTKCGLDWPTEVIEIAQTTGPHVSALTLENVDLVWEEIDYQVEAGFIKVVPEHELSAQGMPENIKILRLAVVPQQKRQGQLILNLSAGVDLAPK
jgi:hypothetical protein